MVTEFSHAFEGTQAKILFDRSALNQRLNEWRSRGLRIGFTNGCFDLIHPGHVKVLEEARAACDRLVVGLNSDSSVARIKPAPRPIIPERARARVLAAFTSVDLVVLFHEDTPRELIEVVRPLVLVKGADYRRKDVIGSDIVNAAGGELVLVELEHGYSTTLIIERLQQLINSVARE
jgi:D-beta-D-heptose 7-phosphate kinase/D-beta-D-heptose 1-phosphate adenosyltransferase